METGTGNFSKENSIKPTLIRKAVEPNYVALIAAVAILVFGFWSIMIALGNINTEITKLRIEFSELRIDFTKLENQSAENYRSLNDRLFKLEYQSTENYRSLNDRLVKLENQSTENHELLNQTAENYKSLNDRFAKLENQSTENETSGMKDLNKSSNHSKVSLSTRQNL